MAGHKRKARDSNDEIDLGPSVRGPPSTGQGHRDAAEEALNKCFFEGFVKEPECAEIWNCLTAMHPYIVKWGRFRAPVKSRPKLNFGIANDQGEFPLYSWGQVVADYSKIEPMPPPVRALGARIEKVFGHSAGYLNHALATFYWNGLDQHIPQHQDKAVDRCSRGRVESKSPIYNVAFGAVRPFIFTDLQCLGKKTRKEIAQYIVKEIPMPSGSMVVLHPEINTQFAHGVPQDRLITELRISLVLRHCDRNWVKPGKYYYRVAPSGKKGAQTPIPA